VIRYELYANYTLAFLKFFQKPEASQSARSKIESSQPACFFVAFFHSSIAEKHKQRTFATTLYFILYTLYFILYTLYFILYTLYFIYYVKRVLQNTDATLPENGRRWS